MVNQNFESCSLKTLRSSLGQTTCASALSQDTKTSFNSMFDLFNERILELCNHTFSLMYNWVFKRYWHNSMIARMARNYCVTKRNERIYEVYVPTQARADIGCMQYYRIIVKVVPEIDRETIEKEHANLLRPRISPAGFNDSELIVFVAPKRSEKAQKERQFFRGFNHTRRKVRGYLTAIIINKSPEICMKRLLVLVANFLKKRIGKLLEKLHFEPWQYDHRKSEYLYYSRLCHIIEQYSPLIANTLRCFSHSLYWILKKLKHVLREIGRQNMIKVVIKKAFELKRLIQEIRFSSPKYIRNGRDPPLIEQLAVLVNENGG